MSNLHNPRSTLHALAPMGPGTPEVESLTSYFCRLAYSHGMTAQKLADWVLERFDNPVCEKYGWHQRNLSSMSPESEQWAAWLSELTGVEALDHHTLSPWRGVLGTPGLASKSDRWCPCCLAEDKANGTDPYLRLSWDIALVNTCLRHKVKLTSMCPHCRRSNVRNRSSIVVPGYCTHCGGFLGDAETEPASPEELWVARQVGLMVQEPPKVASTGLVPLLETVIERMADGRPSIFASRYGFSKSGISHWLNKGGIPALKAWLTIAAHGGIGLDKLFAGDVEGWKPPLVPVQLPMELPESPRAGIKSRELDWDNIRTQLRAMLNEPEAVSVHQASERLGVDRKNLYLRANTEARALADRYLRHRSSLGEQRQARLHAQIEGVLDERLEAGFDGMSARDIWNRLDTEAQSVSSIFRHISAVVDSRRS